MALLKRHIRHHSLEEAEKRNDIGFGTLVTDVPTRLINRDGSFNIKRLSESFWGKLNLYNRLITISWQKFFLLVISYFFITNLIFALAYELIGIEYLHGIELTNEWTKFYDAYFFSAQTLTTVGYGRIAPHGFIASTVASIESLLGLLTFALATGLLYARFSRPEARILYSKNALIAPYLDITGLMFRIVNERQNQLIDVTVELVFTILEQTPEGKKVRKYYGLPLERNKVQFFPMNWTIVHPIIEESPVFGMTREDMLKGEAELFVLIKATEDTFNQSVHSRMSYHAKEMVWGAKYESMIWEKNGMITMDLSKLSDIREVPLTSEYIPDDKYEESEKQAD